MGKGISLSKNSKRRGEIKEEFKIHESIERVDKACMEAVERGEHRGFLDVLKATGNTVCGRHPIGVVMAALEVLGKQSEGEREEDERKGRFRFVRYERSSLVEEIGDSSVSYASAFAVL